MYINVSNQNKKQIFDDFKKNLIEYAAELFCDKISDDTIIDGKNWSNSKKDIMKSNDYEKESWVKELPVESKKLLESLVSA